MQTAVSHGTGFAGRAGRIPTGFNSTSCTLNAVVQPVVLPVCQLAICSTREQTSRISIIAQAKRGRPSKTPTPEPDARGRRRSSEDDGLSGWDAALSGVPVDEDEDADLLNDPALDDVDEDYEDEFEDEDEDALLDDDLDIEDDLEDEDEILDDDDDVPDLSDDLSSIAEDLPYEIENVSYEEAVAQTAPEQAAERPVIRVYSQDELDAIKAEEDAAAAAALAIPEGAQVTLNRQGYATFEMDGVEFLVAETADGQLNLQDSYVYDNGMSYYASPKIEGKMPKGPARLQIIPWTQRKGSDMLKNKQASAKLMKVYFIGIASVSPFQLALDQVYCFVAASRTLKKETVLVEQGVRDPVLRIRPDGIIIQDSGNMPSPVEVSFQDESVLTPEELAARQAEKLEELESQAEQLDELDEAPDLAAGDMM